MRFSPVFIERVQEANNLVDIISQYTQLKPSGGGLMGRCPFPDHQEKTASFSVSEAKQVYHCFGCHKKGNIFTFLRDYSGMSFPEAIEYLASRASIDLPAQEDHQKNQEHNQTAEKKKTLLKINAYACDFFYESFKKLPATHPAKMYAQKRNLTSEIINEFRIGYVSADWDGLFQFLKSKNAPLNLVEELGLIRQKQGSRDHYFDLFRDRLMFPIQSITGETLGFGGRVLSPEQQPKYLNSVDSPVFSKGKILYGLGLSAKHIRTEDFIIIVEGYMDLIALYQAGIKNVGATLGTALTADHGKLIKRHTQNVVVLFDGDTAGQNAAERSLPILLQAGLIPRGLTLPDNKDPDDYVKSEGVEKLNKLIQEAPDLFDLVLNNWLKDYRGTPTEKLKISDKLKPIFAIIDDPRLYELYLKSTAPKILVEEGWLRMALKTESKKIYAQLQQQNKVQENQEVKLTPEEKMELISLKNLSPAEEIILGLSLKKRKYLDIVTESKVLDRILHRGLIKIFQQIQDVTRQSPEKFDKLASLLSTFVDRPEILIVALAAEESVDDARDVKFLNDSIRRVNERYLQNQAQKLALEIKQNPSSEKMEQLMIVQRDLMALKKELGGR